MNLCEGAKQKYTCCLRENGVRCNKKVYKTTEVWGVKHYRCRKHAPMVMVMKNLFLSFVLLFVLFPTGCGAYDAVDYAAPEWMPLLATFEQVVIDSDTGETILTTKGVSCMYYDRDFMEDQAHLIAKYILINEFPEDEFNWEATTQFNFPPTPCSLVDSYPPLTQYEVVSE
jgi:hypothetical protein